eukprot:EG_transcript_19391
MVQKGAVYGAITSPSIPCENQVIDDFPEDGIRRRFETFVSNPLYRLLVATFVFASLCICTLRLNRGTTPKVQQQVSRAVSNDNAKNRVGCVVEVGVSKGRVILYIPTAPWNVIVAQRDWDLKVDEENAHNLKGLENAIHSCAQEARSYTREAPFGSVKFVQLQHTVKDRVERQIVGDLEKNGLEVSGHKEVLSTTRLAAEAQPHQDTEVSSIEAVVQTSASSEKDLNLITDEKAAKERKAMAREMKELKHTKKAKPALAKPLVTSPVPLPEELHHHKPQVPRR